MTGPVERVPLTDERLTVDQAASIADMCERSGGYCGEKLLAQLRAAAEARDLDAEVAGEAAELIGQLRAELRASRAREAELLEAFQNASDSADEWCAAEERVTVERDELQRRIGEALEWCHKANPRPDLNGDLFGDLIAALSGGDGLVTPVVFS